MHVDNDVSAYSGKPRPGYDQLMAAVDAGTVDRIVAWHPDRLHRSPAELEGFIDRITRAGVEVETVQAGRVDLGTPAGRLTARSLGSIARYESEHKAERVRRALAQNAANGKRHGRVPYGWRHEYDQQTGERRDVVDQEAAQVVRDVADRILRGESIREITQRLNDTETPSPRGGPWHKNMVRHVVLRERNAGLRVHQGEVVGEGDWPAIIDRGRWEQVRAVLNDPSRRTSTSSAAAHLLSGIATCGVCGARVRAGTVRGVLSYRCSARSCVSRKRDDVDPFVTEILVRRLAQLDPAMFAAPESRPAVRRALAEATELRDRLDVAADDYADGKIDARQLERITARLRPRLESAEARARAVDGTAVLEGVTGAGVDVVRARWDALPLTRQRAIVDLLLTVRILPTATRSRAFDPEAVEIGWR